MTTFQGIPAEAFAFYAELEDNNNREWWLAHKDSYNALIRDPFMALLDELEPRFGPGKIFRPNRDIRFSQDKSPYKTAQGAFASTQEGLGYHLHLSADGLLVGGGYHSHSPAQLVRYRNSVDASGTGGALQHIVDAVARAGFAVEGEKLKTVPRGFPPEHPRAELLKHKSLSAGAYLGQATWAATPEAVGEIAALWDRLRPLVDWVGRHAAP
ncbi:uncharacterized protein (TIGR02453 family) [Arthrobacter sp. V4I6]|uniref:DUF2461 domain-containing protein n=1 Tax=unclassified Arthrobacter TaxID=235627 RepID=UPI00278A33BE|nr:MULTISPECIES: DUF2461 domain-containing protein [unclassified Arthrobacter]MDQ0819854.1 uncharacterized protein (TIGR02453 family) [Arthrobacter sp. V1I7]MDQ0854033.1 uncharacterized protein (TIGR02453 family) [Arthrobacter sp. V4I6]